MNAETFILLTCGLLIILVLVLFVPLQLSRTKARTDRQFRGDIFRDDDRYWYLGFFYNNPDDPALFVPKRFGLGWTLNFGHPLSILFLMACLLLPLVMLILNVLLFGTTPIGCHPSGCHMP